MLNTVYATVVSKIPYAYIPRDGFTGKIITRVVSPVTYQVIEEYTEYYLSLYGKMFRYYFRRGVWVEVRVM